MDILLYNLSWMVFNLYLALLPVIFSYFLFKMPNRITQWIVGFLWFLYLPNTIYIFTDLHHLVEQWNHVPLLGKGVLLVEYTLLEVVGLTFFLIAFYPVEILLKKIHFEGKSLVFILILFNFLMGFIMTWGKVERVNSWDIFTNIPFVISSLIHLLTSVELIGLGILFGIFANCFYFLFREKVSQWYSKRAGKGVGLLVRLKILPNIT